MRNLLPGGAGVDAVVRAFRHDAGLVCLSGEWAGGGVVLASEPVVLAGPADDVISLLDDPPVRSASPGWRGAICGGWLGALGYATAARLERVPSRCDGRAPFTLGFYDHVVRYDHHRDQWWFEALETPSRAAALERRRCDLAARVATGAPAHDYDLGEWRGAPGRTAHERAVAGAQAHIAAGDVYQVNVCLQFATAFTGDPLDLFCTLRGDVAAPYAAYVATDAGAVVSVSPELFLRRRGRRVETSPIKGTRRRRGCAAADDAQDRDELLASAKDRAENVMIVDVLRNDLGRVCAPGTVEVPALARAEAHPGVWHLVSDVVGALRPGVGDGALVAAAFPPASVTGAPKRRAVELIAELEAAPRGVYTGAIGYSSPVAGLELNVAIRTFEVMGNRVRFGAGGGIVADSDPAAEYEECLAKATPLLSAASAGALSRQTTQPWRGLSSTSSSGSRSVV